MPPSTSTLYTYDAPGGVLPIQRTLLQTITRPLSIFNAPANATKSLIVGDFKNAALSMIPWGGSRDIPIEDITGWENPWANFAADIALDPLLLVGGISPLTKSGKALKGAVDVTKDLRAVKANLRVATKAGETIEALASKELIEDLTKIASERSKLARELLGKNKEPTRAIVNIGLPFTKGVDLGDFEKVRAIAYKFRLLPDPQKVELAGKAQKLSRILINLNKQHIPDTEKIENITAQLAELAAKDAALKAGILHIKPTMALAIKDKLNKFTNIFRGEARAQGQQITKELTSGRIAIKAFEQTEEDKIIVQRLKDLAEQAGVTEKEMSARLVQGAEARWASGAVNSSETFPDVAAQLEKDINKFIKSTRRRHIKQINAGTFDREKFKVMFENKMFQFKKRAEIRRLRLDEATKIMGDLNHDQIKFIDDYVTSQEKFIDKIAKPLGINITALQSSHGYLSWIKRLPNNEALKRLKKKDPVKYARLYSDARIRLGSAHARKIYPEYDILTINKLLRNDYGIDFDFFSTDIAKIISTSKREQYAAAAKATAIHALAEQFGVINKLPNHIETKKLFQAAGLKSDIAPKTYIPKTILEDAKGFSTFLQREITKPETSSIRTFLSIISAINKPFQIGLTTLFPAFHHRNMLNNIMINTWAKNIFFEDYVKAHKLQNLIAKETIIGDDLKLWKEIVEDRIINRGALQQYAQQIKNIKWQAFIERPIKGSIDILKGRINAEDIIRPLSRNANQLDIIPAGAAYGRYLEDNARIAHYLGKRRAGYTRLEASRSVKKFLFNPDEISKIEKTFIQPNFLFYTWTRNNLPLMLKLAFTEPRPAAIYSKLIGSDEDEVPNFLRGGLALRPPFLGSNEFVGSAGLGIEDLFMFNVADADPSGNPVASADQIRRIVERAVTRLSPAWKVPYEFMTGKESYTRRQYENTDMINLIARASPASRIINSADQFMNIFKNDATVRSTLLDFMTGFRTYKVNQKSAIRQTEERRSLSTGKFIRFPIVIPKYKYKENPEVIEQDRRLRKIIRESRNK